MKTDNAFKDGFAQRNSVFGERKKRRLKDIPVSADLTNRYRSNRVRSAYRKSGGKCWFVLVVKKSRSVFSETLWFSFLTLHARMRVRAYI